MEQSIINILYAWRGDIAQWVRHSAPKLLIILFVAAVLIRLLRSATHRLVIFSQRQDLPSGLRAQQLRTLAGVFTSVGSFLITFLAAMQVLPLFGINVQPLLASAGIVGLAIGFGAQTLVKDVINGFFILIEDQFEVGDMVRVGPVTGNVEELTLRRTVLRDPSGALHIVPNSEIKIVSNLTRDWSQVALNVTVSYHEDTDKVIAVLREVVHDFKHDPDFAASLVEEPAVPGIEKVRGDEVDYLVLAKAKPGQHYAVSRELRRRIKLAFEKKGIRVASPNRLYIAEKMPSPEVNS